MDVPKALLADYANVAVGGKLNVLGVFTKIYAANFPAIHPQMQLIFMWEANRSESGRVKEIEIELCDEDGRKIMGLGGQFKVPEGKSGKRVCGNQIITLNNTRFDRPGDYVFNIIISGEHKAEAPFEVAPVQSRG